MEFTNASTAASDPVSDPAFDPASVFEASENDDELSQSSRGGDTGHSDSDTVLEIDAGKTQMRPFELADEEDDKAMDAIGFSGNGELVHLDDTESIDELEEHRPLTISDAQWQTDERTQIVQQIVEKQKKKIRRQRTMIMGVGLLVFMIIAVLVGVYYGGVDPDGTMLVVPKGASERYVVWSLRRQHGDSLYRIVLDRDLDRVTTVVIPDGSSDNEQIVVFHDSSVLSNKNRNSYGDTCSSVRVLSATEVLVKPVVDYNKQWTLLSTSLTNERVSGVGDGDGVVCNPPESDAVLAEQNNNPIELETAAYLGEDEVGFTLDIQTGAVFAGNKNRTLITGVTTGGHYVTSAWSCVGFTGDIQTYCGMVKRTVGADGVANCWAVREMQRSLPETEYDSNDVMLPSSYQRVLLETLGKIAACKTTRACDKSSIEFPCALSNIGRVNTVWALEACELVMSSACDTVYDHCLGTSCSSRFARNEFLAVSHQLNIYNL